MKKYRIGYTTGVFDMFHIGHLNVLKRAKEQCRYLIVGVSSDELVQEYKHKRPVISFEERKEIVASIKYVDEVIDQITLDKYSTWKDLRFEVLFHGDEWRGSDLYNKYIEQFSAVGVDLVFLPHTPGISSSLIVEKIYEK